MTKQLTYAEKLRICAREARVTVGALAAIVVVWLACGFGLAGIDATVLGIPVWALAGTVGTWVFAIIVAVVLSKRVFQDFDLDGDDGAAAAEYDCEAGCEADAEASGVADAEAGRADGEVGHE